MNFSEGLNSPRKLSEFGYEAQILLIRGKFSELEQVIRMAVTEYPQNNQYLLMLSLVDQLGGEVAEMEKDVSRINKLLNQLNNLRRAETE